MELAVREGAIDARLQALVDWEQVPRGAMRVDLAPQADLLARLGQPHRQFRSVHVTGTKGKGSVCALIEAGLLNAGLRTGRYASPHVESVTERICHFGTPVSLAAFEQAAQQALGARDAAIADGTEGRRATWFDVVTAAAFWSFAEACLEWVVVEVGMGGLIDSTNVIEPELAIITNVALEHLETLGPTLADIAAHKAGIAKPGRPMLSGVPTNSVAGRVIDRRVRAVGATLIARAPAEREGLLLRNLGMARAALDALGQRGHRQADGQRALCGEHLPTAIWSALRLPGRLEMRLANASDRPGSMAVVLDGAHVGFALSGVLDELSGLSERLGPPTVVLALFADKDVGEFAARLAGRVRNVLCTALTGTRPNHTPESLAARLRAAEISAQPAGNPREALTRALAGEGSRRWILVTGSLSLVGAIRGMTRDPEVSHPLRQVPRA